MPSPYDPYDPCDVEFAHSICKYVAFLGDGILVMDWRKVSAFLKIFLMMPTREQEGTATGFSTEISTSFVTTDPQLF